MRSLRAILFIALLALFISGCKSKVTKDNYDKIFEGMSLREVESILGEGKPLGDGAMVANQFGVSVSGPAGGSGPDAYVWESDTAKITIYFANGGVKTKLQKGL